MSLMHPALTAQIHVINLQSFLNDSFPVQLTGTIRNEMIKLLSKLILRRRQGYDESMIKLCDYIKESLVKVIKNNCNHM